MNDGRAHVHSAYLYAQVLGSILGVPGKRGREAISIFLDLLFVHCVIVHLLVLPHWNL